MGLDVHLQCVSSGGGCQFPTLPQLVSFGEGVTKVLEVASVVGQSLEVLVFTLKSHAPLMFQWAKL